MSDHLSARPASFVVYVDDNFHYMDEDERYTYGRYDDCPSAVAACMQIVERSLRDVYEPGMTAATLFGQYRGFGDDPFIGGQNTPECKFSAWEFARLRAAEICAEHDGS